MRGFFSNKAMKLMKKFKHFVFVQLPCLTLVFLFSILTPVHFLAIIPFSYYEFIAKIVLSGLALYVVTRTK